MPLKIVPVHPEEPPGKEYREVVRTDQPRQLEVLSEDGVFCPHCKTLQPFDRVSIGSFGWCVECRQCYSSERLVTVTYRTRGTVMTTQELPR